MRQVLADLALEAEAACVLSLRVAGALAQAFTASRIAGACGRFDGAAFGMLPPDTPTGALLARAMPQA